MNKSLWSHPITQQSVRTLQSWGCYIIWPEITSEKVTMAPIEKISDAVYYTLIGGRYDSEQISNDEYYERVVKDCFAEFRRIGEEMLDKALTKNTQGFISKRVDNGILVSSTRSHIGNLSKNEITLIRKKEGNKLFWQGEKKPSSEAPLIYELYESFTEVNGIIHGHSPRVTYDPKMIKYLTPEYVKYGLFGYNDGVIRTLRKNSGFTILKLHGEISMGQTLDDALSKFKQKLEEAHERS